MAQKPIAPLAERFFKRVLKLENSDCWGWAGQIIPAGYARFPIGSSTIPASHVSKELAGDPKPEGKFEACHTCHNRWCVNPDHIYWGTRKQNIQDMVKDGRHWKARNTHCPHGHEYTEENTQRDARGHRICVMCRRRIIAERAGRPFDPLYAPGKGNWPRKPKSAAS